MWGQMFLAAARSDVRGGDLDDLDDEIRMWRPEPGRAGARTVRSGHVQRPSRISTGSGQAQRAVAVSVGLGQLAVDVDGVGAVDVHVLVVGRPDVRQRLIVADAAVPA